MEQNDIKCIIVSGPDNSGKDALCSQLKSRIENETGKYVVYVCPKFCRDLDDWSKDQKGLKKFAERFVETMPDDCVLLLNRSWLDEFVYGPIYRGAEEKDVEWIFSLSPLLLSKLSYYSLYDDPEVLAAREDGKSFSAGEPEIISRELRRFEELCARLERSGAKTKLCKSTAVPLNEMWTFAADSI